MFAALLRSYTPSKKKDPQPRFLAMSKQQSTRLILGGISCKVDEKEIVSLPSDQGLDYALKLNRRQTRIALVGYSALNKVWLFSEKTLTLTESNFPLVLPNLLPINAILLNGNLGVAFSGKEVYILRPGQPATLLEGVEPKRGYCMQECVEGDRPFKLVREGSHVYLLYLTNSGQLHYIVLSNSNPQTTPILNAPEKIELFKFYTDDRKLTLVTPGGDLKVYILKQKSLVLLREFSLGSNPLLPCTLATFGSRVVVSYMLKGFRTSTLTSSINLFESTSSAGIVPLASTQVDSENTKFDFAYSPNPIHQFQLLSPRLLLAVFNANKLEVFGYVKEMSRLHSVGRVILKGTAIPMWLSSHRMIDVWRVNLVHKHSHRQRVDGPDVSKEQVHELRILTSDNKIYRANICVKL